MDSREQCGCKGARYCHLCIHTDRVQSLRAAPDIRLDTAASQLRLWGVASGSHQCHVWCGRCGRAHSHSADGGVELEDIRRLSQAADCEPAGDDVSLDGMRLIVDFVSEEEERALVHSIDKRPWALSQSGRRKQDYGPKVNFKRQRMKPEAFEGVPHYAPALLAKMARHGVADYVPIEMCNLEYCRERASAIEPHVDDTWVWGDRLISVNLLSGAVITFVHTSLDQCVFVYMPRRSLLLMSGACRYEWKHAVTALHVDQPRRIALTMREADDKFKPGGRLHDGGGGSELLRRGQTVLPECHGVAECA